MDRVATRRGFLVLAGTLPLGGCSPADDLARAGGKGAGKAADDVASGGNGGDAQDEAEGDGLPDAHGNHGVVAIGEGRTQGRGVGLFVAANAGETTASAAVVEYEFTVERGSSANAAVLSREDADEISRGVRDPAHDYRLLIEDRTGGRARGTVPFGEYVLFFWTPRTADRDDGEETDRSTVIDFEYAVTYRE